MSKKKNEFKDLNIHGSGGDGVHLNAEPGTVTVIKNATVRNSAGHGIYLGHTPPAQPPQLPARRKVGWKTIGIVLATLAALVAFLADGAQVLESQMLKDTLGWFKAALSSGAT